MIIPIPPYPAALVKRQRTRTLVITDLHIGWEMALVQKGIHVPSQTSKMLKNLTELILKHKPKELLILGDVKHTVATAETSEWHDVPDFFAALKKQVENISVLRGNHDGNLEPLLPESVKLLPASGVAMDDVGFFHGHQWPSPTLLSCKTLVMGHVHPAIAFRDIAGFRISRQVWVKSRCNGLILTKILLEKYKVKIESTPVKALKKFFDITPKTMQLFIMPSFNEFLGGKPLNEARWNVQFPKNESIVGPILRSEAVDLDAAEISLLDGTFLGSLHSLKT
jgi:putative SbcD/Mre11-related phosphoesterase